MVDPNEYVDAFDVAVALEKSDELVHTKGIPSIAVRSLYDAIFKSPSQIEPAVHTMWLVNGSLGRAVGRARLKGFGFALIGMDRRWQSTDSDAWSASGRTFANREYCYVFLRYDVTSSCVYSSLSPSLYSML